MKVSGSVCLITGSAQGLGRAFAERLLGAGARVCISDVREDRGLATLEELAQRFGRERVTFIQCDVTQEDQFNRLFDGCESHFSVAAVDLLVNNAGVNTNPGWRKCLEVNTLGVMSGTEIALRRMRKHGKPGTIVNVASMAGVTTGAGFGEDIWPYYSSKHAVVQMTRTLSANMGESDVQLKALCPSFADTEIVSSMGEEKEAEVARQFGLLSCAAVADAFYSLVTECPRGSVMGVVHGLPPFLIPDTSRAQVKALALMTLLSSKVMGNSTVQVGTYRTILCLLVGLLLLLQLLLLHLVS